MPDESDSTLLRRYAKSKKDDVFQALVCRHLDAVYAAALRRVAGDFHLAEDVSQQVFVALAQQADQVSQHPAFAAWLHTCTRNVAARVVRTERRRKSREQQAFAMSEIDATPRDQTDWSQVKPVLDGALDKLKEADRAAVLLRLVYRRSLAQVGSELQISEDCARMRIERALARLRILLKQRGVNSSAAALASGLLTHAATPAPAGLSGSIAASVAAASSGSAIAVTSAGFLGGHFAQSVIMALTNKVLVGTAVILAGVVAVQYRTLQAKEIEVARLEAETNRADIQSHIAARSLTSPITRRPSRAPKLADGSPEDSVRDLEVKILNLKKRLGLEPRQSIPEFIYLRDIDWILALQERGSLATDEDYKRVFIDLRSRAMDRFTGLLIPALDHFIKNSGGHAPKGPDDLAPFVGVPVSPSVFARYEVVPAGDGAKSPWTIQPKLGAAATPDQGAEPTGRAGFGDPK